MSNLTSKHKTRGQAFANLLDEIARSAPDETSRRHVHSVARRLRRHYGTSDAEKWEIIKAALEDGCSTYEEIAEVTRLHKPTVIDLIKTKRGAGEVCVIQLPRGRMGGRPKLFIRLVAVKSP